MHRALLLACCSCALAALPAEAIAPVTGRVTGFDLLQVNQLVIHVKPGGSHPLCQAIPITAVRVRGAWAHARRGSVLRVVLRVPHHGPRTRWIHAATTSGTRRVEFSPEKLTGGAFPGGRYSASLRAGERTLSRGVFRLTEATTAC